MSREHERRLERDRLFKMVEDRLLFCSRHDEVITPRIFWARECYKGRTENGCKYVTVVRT